ncbi:MAG: hypothetical protein GF344_03275, partial [Chitinivibrionales bacterium]|nr:hypothetical protein [Chitinivibrionales bacterium]
MKENYFAKLKEKTDTRLWVNNPTVPEVHQALEHGAVCCTTNPTYGANMLRRDTAFAEEVIDRTLGQSDNNSVVADLVQQRLVARIIELFRPLHKESEGRYGYVSIQGDPYADIDAEHIL